MQASNEVRKSSIEGRGGMWKPPKAGEEKIVRLSTNNADDIARSNNNDEKSQLSSFGTLHDRLQMLCEDHEWEMADNETTARKASRTCGIRQGDLQVEFSIPEDAAKNNIILTAVVHNAAASLLVPPPRTVSPDVNSNTAIRKRPLGSRASVSRDTSPIRPRKRPSYSLMTKMMKIKAILSERHEEFQTSVFDGKFILYHSIPVSTLPTNDFEITIQNFMMIAFEIQGEFQ